MDLCIMFPLQDLHLLHAEGCLHRGHGRPMEEPHRGSE